MEENKTTKEETQTVVTEQKTEEQLKIESLEAEKVKLISDNANYKVALMKRDKKENIDPEETEDEKIRRIAREVSMETRISEIDKEKETLIQKTLKENGELKLALKNKTGTSTATATSTETTKVQDTSITPEQLSAFKARGWTDKDIERYKKNLNRYGK